MIDHKINITVNTRRITADMLTPVLVYLSLRDRYTDPVLLESNESRDNAHYYSFIGLDTLADFKVAKGVINVRLPRQQTGGMRVRDHEHVPDALQRFTDRFEFDYGDHPELEPFNGLIGHTNFEGVQYFDTLSFDEEKRVLRSPDIRYHLYRFVLIYQHYRDELILLENCPTGEASRLDELEGYLRRPGAVHPFRPTGEERSNLTDEQFRELVSKGKHHCQVGDVFQIVLSRQFQRDFQGDEFQVYRALRSVNPSPYLFYFDYGDYRIMGSSPEAQLVIDGETARLNPIAGTYKRTGNDEVDQAATAALLKDPKENAEHVMLVDLARNDLSRHTSKVEVKSLRDVHYYSHVIHLVSTVEGRLEDRSQAARIFGDTFPAGTLSGAPKYKALELIGEYENQQRGFYGGAIGFVNFNGNINQAILIRSFFSQDNTLYYQAGAGVVAASDEESETQEVYNKLRALTKSLDKAVKL
ncbi:anthranilate synthase component I [Lewinellaceae bacterium SD302]|nr:anthranilate synthase component I [Lewinellaceae bacterium SD302]